MGPVTITSHRYRLRPSSMHLRLGLIAAVSTLRYHPFVYIPACFIKPIVLCRWIVVRCILYWRDIVRRGRPQSGTQTIIEQSDGYSKIAVFDY